MNVIALLEFELAYYNSAVHHFNHYTTRTPPNLVTTDTKKRTCHIVDFVVLMDHRVKIKESKKRDNHFDLARELRKLGKMTLISLVISLGKGTGRIGSWKKNQDHSDYSIVWIGLNTQKNLAGS